MIGRDIFRFAMLAPPAMLLVLLGLTAGCDDGQTYEQQRRAALTLADHGEDQRAALEALLAAHEQRKDDAAINHRLGRVYAEMKLHEPSLHHFDLAWRERPQDRLTLLSIVRLEVRLGKLASAEEHLKPLLEDSEFRGEGLYEMAVIRDSQGRRDDALAIVSALDGLSPSQAYRCASMHGRFLLEQGEMERARERFAAALAGRGDYKEALKGVADSLRRLGRDDEADRWDRILGLVVELTDNVYMRSIEAADQRIAVLEELCRIYPEWVDGFRRLAELQLKLGNPEAACRAIEAFLLKHPEVPNAQAEKLRSNYCAERNP